jgi:hypothetical protein
MGVLSTLPWLVCCVGVVKDGELLIEMAAGYMNGTCGKIGGPQIDDVVRFAFYHLNGTVWSSQHCTKKLE